MPTKERRLRESQKREKHERLQNEIPEHIKNRIDARERSEMPSSAIIEAVINSDPPYLKLKGGLITEGSDGTVSVALAKGGDRYINDIRKDASTQEQKALKKMYPEYWGKRGGPKAIALRELEKPIDARAVKREPPISVRTLQNYFREIRKTARVP